MADGVAKSNRSYQDLLHADPEGNEFMQAISEAGGSSDRASALVFTTHIDLILTKRIQINLVRNDSGTMKDLTKQGGVLSTMSNKTVYAFATGLIDEKTRSELDIIRKIRNAFAHSALPLTFEENAISRLCAELDFEGMEFYLGDAKDEGWSKDWSLSKRQFCFTSVGYILRMTREYNAQWKLKMEQAKNAVEESSGMTAKLKRLMKGDS